VHKSGHKTPIIIIIIIGVPNTGFIDKHILTYKFPGLSIIFPCQIPGAFQRILNVQKYAPIFSMKAGPQWMDIELT